MSGKRVGEGESGRGQDLSPVRAADEKTQRAVWGVLGLFRVSGMPLHAKCVMCKRQGRRRGGSIAGSGGLRLAEKFTPGGKVYDFFRKKLLSGI